MREITCKFSKRCCVCDDWVEQGKQALYEDATKQIWHIQCDPRTDFSPKFGETPDQVAERLGFKSWKPE